MKQSLLFLLLLFPVLLITDVSYGKVLYDQTGRMVRIETSPRRVISLAPSITEIVYDLGKGSLLKGATQYSNIPEAATKLPRVGSYVRLDLEKIVSLKPDLCIAIKDGNPKHTVEKIIQLGIPVYVINPRSLEGIMSAIRGIGGALDAPEQAEAIVADMKTRIGRIEEITSQLTRRPKVFFQIDASPLFYSEVENMAQLEDGYRRLFHLTGTKERLEHGTD